MSDSQILSLPYILPAQAQKHVTHNEAIKALDVLVQLSVLNRDQTTPPASPGEGDRHLVGAGATGDWLGQDDKIAAYLGGVWVFHTPAAGWRAYVRSEALVLVYDGSGWDVALQNLPYVGVNTTADTTNRLAVSSAATLLSHAGDDHQLKINKNAAVDTASLLFQSGWSGRAEMGLAGGDDFSLKVSDDGSSFQTALSVDRSTGEVGFPVGVNFGADRLQHYEEGTWTPSLNFGGASTGMTYDVQTGKYTRIGNMVFLQFAIDLATKGSATGAAEVTGLPFTANPAYYPGSVFFIGGGTGLQSPQCRMIPGAKIVLVNGTSSGTAAMNEGNFNDITNFKGSISFFV